MKVAMVSEHASPLAVLDGSSADGQNVHIAELSAAISRHGHDVTVYTRRRDKETPERVNTPQGYTVVHVTAGPPTRSPAHELLEHTSAFAQYLDDQWGRERPDVAHAHFWTSGIATQLAARAQSIPTVQTFHGLGQIERRHHGDTCPSERVALEKLVASHATWVAATSTEEVFELVRMGRSRTKVSVVPYGVDLDMFSTEGPVAERGASHRIVAVGKLLPRNGFDTMIEALPTIADAEFVIVGGSDRARLNSDPEVRRLRNLAAQLGVEDRVRFTGPLPRSEMPAMLRSADVVTCTQWHGPFGVVPLEAMACGIPVVASAVSDMLDTVVDDVTGRLVTPRKPRECADAVSAILRDSFMGRSLGLAGRDRICARYSWDRVSADTLRIYEQLVAASTAPAAP